jgi:uroporphyrinogen decarboxylase
MPVGATQIDLAMLTTASPSHVRATTVHETHAWKRSTSAYTSRQRFLDACHCRATDRPPIWMMRQAGRCLPEYRALKEKHSFLELVRTPELACEVTLQPVRRFGFDAAILFSDILVVPEAMGQSYHFRDTGGVEMEFPLRDASDIARLSTDAIEDKLHYVTEALRFIKPQLASRTALLGFAGSPWTLANFMLDGGSSKTHARALQLLREDRALLNTLLQKLTIAVTKFLRAQIDAGVDAVQIFDSHGGLLPNELFAAGSGEWMRRIIAEIDEEIPVIVFSKGARDWKTLLSLGANVIGIDPAFDLAAARESFPNDIAIQGNLAPELLLHLTPEELALKTAQLLEKMRGRPGHIFNLGHGVPPAAPLENIASVVRTVREFSDNNSVQHS